MRIVLPPLAPAIARAVSRKLTHAGHEVRFEEGLPHDGSKGLELQIGRTALDVAPLVSASSGVAFEVARRVRDGAPLLLPEDEHAIFHLAWAVDLGTAIAHAASTQPEGRFVLSDREAWTLDSLANAFEVLLDRPSQIVRAAPEAIARVSSVPDAPPGRDGARLPGFEPTPAARWLPAVLDAAASHPAPDTRVREIALARHLLRRTS